MRRVIPKHQCGFDYFRYNQYRPKSDFNAVSGGGGVSGNLDQLMVFDNYSGGDIGNAATDQCNDFIPDAENYTNHHDYGRWNLRP